MTLGDVSLAQRAAGLLPAVAAEGQVPVDVFLVGISDLAAGARDRLAVRVADPADHVRWALMRDMNDLPAPPRTPEAPDLLTRALGDRCPQVRLEAIGVLRRLREGRDVVRQSLKRETVVAVKDAPSEALARPNWHEEESGDL